MAMSANRVDAVAEKWRVFAVRQMFAQEVAERMAAIAQGHVEMVDSLTVSWIHLENDLGSYIKTGRWPESGEGGGEVSEKSYESSVGPMEVPRSTLADRVYKLEQMLAVFDKALGAAGERIEGLEHGIKTLEGEIGLSRTTRERRE